MFAAWLSGEVQGYAALVGVQVEEQAAFFGMGNVAGEGACSSGHISDSGPFHLDDVGPLVGHQLGAIGAGQVLGEVQDLYVGEGLVRHGRLTAPV